MKSKFFLRKVFLMISTFIFLSFNYVNAAVPTIDTLESTEATINSINQTNVWFTIKWITDSDTWDNMIYKYSWDWTNYSDLNINSTQKEYTASEDLDRWDAVYNIPEFTDSLLQEIDEWNTNNYLYVSWAWTQTLFDFTTSSTHESLSEISLYMRRNYSYPDTDLRLDIKNWSTTILSSTIWHDTLFYWWSSTHDWVSFDFSWSLLPNTTYSLSLYVTSSAWFSIWKATNNVDYNNRIYEKKSTWFWDNSVWKATATDSVKSEFVGFVKENVTAWNSVLVDVAWESITQELMWSGSTYYLSDTLWEISTTPWTISKTIGTAISDTTIDLINSIYDDSEITFNLDTSGQVDWELTLYVKANDWTNDSNVATLNITKNTDAPVIIITNPIVETQEQTISAIVDKWTLTMSETRWEVCDDTLSFITYEVSTYNQNADNWIKICFKAVDSYGNTSFALSTKVWWITKGDYMWGDIFYGYENWYNSPYSKANDSQLAILKLMVWDSIAWDTESTNYPNSFVDLNWDGLVDMLYIGRFRTGEWTDAYDKISYWIMINNWDMTFSTTYRCVKYYNSLTWTIYYWDCAE